MKMTNAELKQILALQTNTVDLETCWMEGYAYGQAEGNDINNPYKHGSLEADYFNEGWWAGFYQEEALFPEHAVEIDTDVQPQKQNVRLMKSNKLKALVIGTAVSFGGLALIANEILEMAA